MLLAVGIALALTGGAIALYDWTQHRDLFRSLTPKSPPPRVFAAFLLAFAGGFLMGQYERRPDIPPLLATDDVAILAFQATMGAGGIIDVEILAKNRSSSKPLLSVTLTLTALDCKERVIEPDCRELESREVWFPLNARARGSRTMKRAYARINPPQDNLMWDMKILGVVLGN